ncbi:TetR/AcrR family transcriptional regulator [Nocardioides bruguierae]|uniref:TetR/AcrR family transcriptional regulator n=1 Tax=Nocardioides bruguierae TaxID=2945102 RepID=UPI002020B151|nr:TetR/AcrR family transcriptional regulator [Nocardioides bruguierae]MCL8024851.1 TetR/AcrR family transcriptional regulator [Nocardioides bruguierae]
MGLREENAARTRRTILDVALGLFLDHGYESTTMEEIAAAAGVGSSTLYRYFASKDLLLVEPLQVVGRLADALLRRPEQEPIEVALGEMLLDVLAAPREHSLVTRAQAVVHATPSVRGRVLELVADERRELEQAVLARMGRERGDLQALMTARTAGLVLEYYSELSEQMQADGVWTPEVEVRREGIAVHLRETLARLTVAPPLLPRLP